MDTRTQQSPTLLLDECPLGELEESKVWRMNCKKIKPEIEYSTSMTVCLTEEDLIKAYALNQLQFPDMYAEEAEPFESSLQDALDHARTKRYKAVVIVNGQGCVLEEISVIN